MFKGKGRTKAAALLLAITMLVGSFPFVYAEGGEGSENVTEAAPMPVEDVTVEAEPEPTEAPTPEPTAEPTAEPTPEPTAEPTAEPTPEPVEAPTEVTPEPVTVEETPVPAETESAEQSPEPATESETAVVGEISGQEAPELETEPTMDDAEAEEEEVIDEDFDDWSDSEEMGDEEFIELDEWDMGAISAELLDQFNNPDSVEQIEFHGSADIEIKNEGMLEFGQEVTLIARLDDELSFRLVWEANDKDDRGWYTIGSGTEYSFILEEDILEREYRVVLYTVD